LGLDHYISQDKAGKMTQKITTPEMECALAGWFDYRQNLIVPCVYWGVGYYTHECDLLIVSRAGYVTEVEIKISRSDLRADARTSALSTCILLYLRSWKPRHWSLRPSEPALSQ